MVQIIQTKQFIRRKIFKKVPLNEAAIVKCSKLLQFIPKTETQAQTKRRRSTDWLAKQSKRLIGQAPVHAFLLVDAFASWAHTASTVHARAHYVC